VLRHDLDGDRRAIAGLLDQRMDARNIDRAVAHHGAVEHPFAAGMAPAPPPIRVNRAPALTLWATVVAERLGYPPETALTLGRFVAGSSARAKAQRLGIIEETQEAAERRARAAELKPRPQTVRLLGRDVPVLAAADGTLRAEDDGKPASDTTVQSYVARAFGDRLGDARAAMEALAASLPPEELNSNEGRVFERLTEGAMAVSRKAHIATELARSAYRDEL
jgi:hypothetical protein